MNQFRKNRRRGAAAVEMALLAPIFCTVAMGIFEIGRAEMVRSCLSDAARAGCRTGVKPGQGNADIIADVNDILTNEGIPAGKATITILVSGASTDALKAQGGIDSVSVQVSIPVSSVNWVILRFLSGSKFESETVAMLKQG
ncbi:MAG TPA: TadE/TadG family type IV pilus assembly protein [Pirellulales bacterium]|nr:TadE/TadG family type IV pilus assembly protein [Pirellulales bacterium]